LGGGGETDGYVVLLDLSKGTPPPPKPSVTPPKPLTYHRDAKRPDPKKPEPTAAPGAAFHFSATSPKYVTVDGEFRDSKNELWPSFLCGKPVEGAAAWNDGALNASVTLALPMWTQPNGLQDRRVLHGLIRSGDAPPPVQFRLESMGKPKTEELRHTDDQGREQVRSVTYSEAKGVLDVAGKRLEVNPRVTWVFSAPARDNTRSGIRMTAWFTFKGSQLGLPGKAGTADIEAKISWTGQEGAAPPPGPQPSKKKT